MPQYEFVCSACEKKFSLVLTLSEYEKREIKCPKCSRKKVEQCWAAFYGVTSKKG